ncbi:MAG: TonB-dependent receptor [Gemmatimonadetes bacterium]|nr:TonB-dependent receptor [Gemmatimonadota bacterium]
MLDEVTQRPIVGARVLGQGTSADVRSDAEGSFRLAGLTGDSVTLEVRMLGYVALLRTVAVGATDVRLLIVRTALKLDQVVVTGTAGGAQRRTLGNAVDQIDIGEVQKTMPVNEVQSMINGRSAGVTVAPGTGMVGAGPRIRIRGVTTLSLSDQPLVYVDGIRVNNNVASGPTNQGYGSGSISRLGDFSPEDIESIEIIKGPAAATLYGTEAANGVIQIITKKGRIDAPAEWDVSVRQGANWFDNAAGRVPENWGLDKDGQLIGVNLVELEAARGTPLFRTGHLQNYDLSVKGGSPRSRYFLSGQSQRNQGIDVNNDLWRYSMRSNLGLQLSNKWNVDANLSYVKASTNLASDIGAGVLFNTMFSTNVDINGPRRGFRSSPPEIFHTRGMANQELDHFTGSVIVSHTPFSWLTQRLTLGLDQTQEINSTISTYLSGADAAFFSPTSARGSKSRNDVAAAVNTVDYVITANKSLGPNVSSSSSFGLQYFRRATNTLATTGSQFTGPGLTTLTGTALTNAGEDLIANVTVGSYAQQQLGWKDRLFITGALRVDNNSAFGEDFKWVTYPKGSLSWVVNEMPFWTVDAVSSLRVRAAYGASGHQPDAFAALRTFQPVTIGGGEGGVSPQFVGNPELRPERGRELEMGVDAGLLNERFGVHFNFYSGRTDDAILLKPLAPSNGFPGSQYVNAGSLKNSGVELALDAQLMQRRAFEWSVGFNISSNSNEVLDVSAVASGADVNGADYIKFPSNLDTPGIHLRHQVGYPAGSYFGHKIVSATLDQNGVARDVMCAGGFKSGSPLPCADAPDVFLGQTDPKVLGAITNTFTFFNRLTLSTLVDWKQGFVHGENDTLVRCQLFQNCRAYWFPLEYNPVFVAGIQSSSLHDFAAADASFVKLRQVTIGYRVPESFAQRLGAKSLRVVAAANNLRTWTDWTSLDPETYFLNNTFDKWSQTFTPNPMSVSFTVNAIF